MFNAKYSIYNDTIVIDIGQITVFHWGSSFTTIVIEQFLRTENGGDRKNSKS